MIDDLWSQFHLPSALAGVGIGSSAMAVLGWLVNRWFTIRTKQADQVLDVCLKLRIFVGKWFDAIANAVVEGKSPEQVREKLGIFMAAHPFEDELATITPILMTYPACATLLKLTEKFHQDALEHKGALYEALSPNEFYEDFPTHRAAALKALREPLEACQTEIDRLTGVLTKQKYRYFAWRTAQ